MGYFANKEARSTPPIIACYCKGGCDSRSDVTAELERLFLSLLRAGEREERPRTTGTACTRVLP